MGANGSSTGPADGRSPAEEMTGRAGGLAVAPEMHDAELAANIPRREPLIDNRVLFISAVAVGVAAVAAVIARLLTGLIGLVTNLAFFGRLSTEFIQPAGHHLGLFVIVVPVIGGVIVGFMARYGSRAIRGHGIPEAMEQILTNESRIPPRITFLKPLSAAVAIGTGGPFGAEGPIIATGGALGSVIGQILRVTAVERKTLLAAGAAAGMSATFGSPISAVVLAVELLLFEFRPRSVIPVALASVTAAGVRNILVGSAPVFPMEHVTAPSGGALLFYVLLGALVGLAAAAVTRIVYAIEDAFEHLPIHWMWWPAIGGLAVGVVGYFAPRTLGVGYSNIESLVAGDFTVRTILFLCLMKFVSWSISLGSGTSGGTLAPLFTIGGGLGAVLTAGAAGVAPTIGLDMRIGALVGMAAIFAGASRAFLASVLFALETTGQPAGLLPLLAGCTAAYLISCFLMRNTIMTEKIVRRGVRVPAEYSADYLDRLLVREVATMPARSVPANWSIQQVGQWLRSGAPEARHGGYPVVDAQGVLVGVITRRDVFESGKSAEASVRELITRPVQVAFEDHSLREAADHMVRSHVGRLVVVREDRPEIPVGILTRSDLLCAHARRLEESDRARRVLRVRQAIKRRLGIQR